MASYRVLTGLLASQAAASLYGESSLNHSCVLANPLLSCSPPTLAENASEVLDTCCVETFGGLFLSTQFWDTYTALEDQGQLFPDNKWTLHGLWPDFCNGSFTQYCDLDRQFDPAPPKTIPKYTGPKVDTFLTALGKLDLLNWMNTYWINQGAPNTDFWAHEFSRHGTCFSTFDVPCYGPSYSEHQEMVDFYQTAIKYYLRLPTWDWLSAAGIAPSNTTTYSLSDVQAALTQGYGTLPYLGCSGPKYNKTVAGHGTTDAGHVYLDEVWYYFHAKGRPQDGDWVPAHASVSGSAVTTCASSKGALRYLERTTESIR